MNYVRRYLKLLFKHQWSMKQFWLLQGLNVILNLLLNLRFDLGSLIHVFIVIALVYPLFFILFNPANPNPQWWKR